MRCSFSGFKNTQMLEDRDRKYKDELIENTQDEKEK